MRSIWGILRGTLWEKQGEFSLKRKLAAELGKG